MPSYTLELQLSSLYLGDIPTLEILADGAVHSSHTVSLSGTTLNLTVNYSGALPSSLAFRFDDASAEPDRFVQIHSVKINDHYVNTSNYLYGDNLSDGDTVSVDVASSYFIYDPSEPDAGEFAPPTVALTTGDDILVYNGSADYVIDGLAGRDSIRLGSGNDKINGGSGDDILRGSGGNDLIYGAEGLDIMYGGEGNDIMYGGDDFDRITGDEGDDEMHGNDGDDKLYGNEGNDVMTGGLGDDDLLGHEGDDIIFGNEGDDRLSGHDGNDTLDGGAGNDVLRAAAGDDVLNGGDDNDQLFGGAGNDILYGNDGNDTLYGNDGLSGTVVGGNDILYGGSGDDILFSESLITLDATIASILSANSGVAYNADTNSFYQYVAATGSWNAANAAASSATLTGLSGVNGHLVTITSDAENTYVSGLAGSNNVWIGASDSSSEGNWSWTGGPEAGIEFWSGGAGGSGNNSLYSNWQAGGPTNDFLIFTNDHAVLQANGEWNAPTEGILTNFGYVIEWEASSLINTVDNVILDGGLGEDNLNGDVGIDIFDLNNNDAVDTIYDFDAAGRDQLDVSDLISGYDPLADDLNDFIQLTEASGDTTISIDSDGASGGTNYVDVAVLDGITGLNLDLLLAGDNLTVS